MKNSLSFEDTDLAVSWQFLGNYGNWAYYEAKFILENQGQESLGAEGWALYFNQQGLGVIDESVRGGVRIEHLNGDFLRMVPEQGFLLEPGARLEIFYRKPGWLLRKSDAPQKPYLVFGEQEIVQVAYSLDDFPGLSCFYPEESGIAWPDAGWIYEQNSGLQDVQAEQLERVLPSPESSVYGTGMLSMDAATQIHFAEGLAREAEYLAEMLKGYLGWRPEISLSAQAGPGIIHLALKANEGGAESYRLKVTEDAGVLIQGEEAAGVFYGIQSLLSSLPTQTWKGEKEVLEVPLMELEDQPAFAYRGFMLDIARNFTEPEAIKKLIRLMSFYKLNRLHLHMTDDEGWRLEIPSLPELTEVGARRGHTADESEYLIPAYGSGPDPEPSASHGSGYISRAEFIDLLEFAADHHVQIIPEINFPGHARAAIKSMEKRYARLLDEGEKDMAERYRLIDPDDASEYNSAQNFNDNVICVTTEGPYRFFEAVVDELISMYKEAGLELNTLHTGGDEVPYGVWTGSPLSKEFLDQNPEIGAVENLQAYFGGRIYEILESRDLTMAGWEEIAMKKNEQGQWIPNPAFQGKDVLPYVWNSIFDNLDLGNRLANAGFPVILCNVTNFYFDLAYSHHPAERGLSWGGFVNTRRAFEFSPYHVFHTTLENMWGKAYEADDFAGKEELQVRAREHIVGLQAQLWSETLKGGKMAEYYYAPKIIAFAERAWTGEPAWGSIEDMEQRMMAMSADWNQFANRIAKRELPRLDYLYGAYQYRLPPPGAILEDGILKANVDFPGLELRYTTDGTDPAGDSPLYRGPVEVKGKVKLASFDLQGRRSRISTVE